MNVFSSVLISSQSRTFFSEKFFIYFPLTFLGHILNFSEKKNFFFLPISDPSVLLLAQDKEYLPECSPVTLFTSLLRALSYLSVFCRCCKELLLFLLFLILTAGLRNTHSTKKKKRGQFSLTITSVPTANLS